MRKSLKGISPISFYGSAVISLGLIIYACLAPDAAATLFKHANNWIINEAGWFYLLSVGGFVIFLIFLAASKLGNVKLGPDDAVPDYSYGTWVAMLFSAGMGIGIVFYGVAEPIMHFSTPPDAVPQSAQAARDAMEITFFHWGVHAWAIYAVMGLALAYFGYRKGEPLVIRSAFRPLIGDRVNGPLGDIIDIFSVVGTLAGLATSLGLGVAQLNATGAYLFGLPQNLETQLILIGTVTALATITVATGLDNGIRRLSEMIIIVSFFLMFLILALGPTRFLLQAFVENIGLYLNAFVARTFHIYAYEPSDWVGSWTLFYWGWWISWAPFVGLFIARISRGRTIRQLILGVLFAPAGFSFIWFTIFGDLAIWLDLNVADGAISSIVTENMPIALFTVFEYLPWSTFLAGLTGLLVAVYFITASDSGALVIAMITSRGEEEPVLWLRIFWALVCGAFAACLLLAGGLDAVEMAAVIAGLPLAILMSFMCYGIWKALNDEVALLASADLQPAPMVPNEAARFWSRRIHAIISHPSRKQVNNFIQSTVRKAMETVAAELEQPEYLNAHVDQNEESLKLTINYGDSATPFIYEVRPVSTPIPAFATAGPAHSSSTRNHYFRAEIFLAQGGRGYDIYGYAMDQVIADIVNHYDRHQHYLALRATPVKS